MRSRRPTRMNTRIQRPRLSSSRSFGNLDHRAQRLRNALWGAFVGDALAMPVHWYYDRGALRRDYGTVANYLAPKNPHPDSILWRSRCDLLQPQYDILHDQRPYWGRRDVHYHQFLVPGENTLNLKLAEVLLASIQDKSGYDVDAYLDRYIDFLRQPGRHNDTYIEECHRHFFENLARGMSPRAAGKSDSHIGGLVAVPIIAALHHENPSAARAAVRTHVGLTHCCPETLAFADSLTCLLLAVFDGTSMLEAAEDVAHAVPDARLVPARLVDWAAEPDAQVVGGRLSNACYVDEAFPSVLYLALKYAGNFEQGLIANTNLGGDNCHRGAVLGALLGAASDSDPIPARWRADLEARARLEPLIESLVRLMV